MKVFLIKTQMDYRDGHVRVINVVIVLIELKEATKQESCIGRIILVEDSYENWRKEQMEDPCIFLFLSKKEAGEERPLWQEASAKDILYWSYWDFLEIKEGVFYKRWEAPNLKKKRFSI